MANLPKHRVTPSRPFLHSGVDYAGPIQIKTWKGRGHRSYKAYVAVFICLSTRAVHLEAVTSLSSDDFLAAFNRFVAHRGICSDVYSDRGTTFVGANSELQDLFKSAAKSWDNDIVEVMSSKGIQWHFIPPYSPHFGGLWESAVKSFKHHFRRVTARRLLTFEEMTTLLATIEACLNSRPISYISNDPSDPLPLTPGHFLIGDTLQAIPEPNILDTNPNYLTRWRFVLQMKQHFWQRWASEYLHSLQQRNKWATSSANIKVGDIVLVNEPQPPNSWFLARVKELHPGKDGLVRVVTLRSRGSTFKRPIAKLCLLPLSEDNRLGEVPSGPAC